MTQPSGSRPIPQLREPPLVGSLFDFQARRLETLLRVGTECGEIGSFSMGPIKVVLLNSPELVETVLLKEAHRMGRGPFYKMVKVLTGEHSFFSKEGEPHRKLRLLTAPLFQHKRLVSYLPSMVEYADQFQQKVRDGEPVDVEQEMMRLAQRIVEKTIFNRDEGEDPAEIFEAIKVGLEYVGYLLTNLITPPLVVPTRRNLEMKRALKILRRRSQDLIDGWRAAGSVDKGDFLSMLMLLRREDGSALENEEIIDHVHTLYNAGHETTAVTLMWIFYHLSRNPDVEEKFHREIDTVLNGKRVEYADLARLPYTLQIVKEALRLHSPAYLFGRAPREDVDVLGYRLRKGQFILISPYVLHRNPKYFPDPERFDPERFSPENEKMLPRCAYVPFGIGPMVCIGQHFAMLEVHAVVAQIAQYLRFKLAPNQDISLLPMLTMRPSSMRMIAYRRSPARGQQEGECLKQPA